ncbi:hypothetical protein SSYM_0927, partial [Serratia symbiotica str. Tucson]
GNKQLSFGRINCRYLLPGPLITLALVRLIISCCRSLLSTIKRMRQ